MSSANWLPDKGVAEVFEQKGKLLQRMGDAHMPWHVTPAIEHLRRQAFPDSRSFLQASYRKATSTCTSRKPCEPRFLYLCTFLVRNFGTSDSLACPPNRYIMERGQLRLYSSGDVSRQLLTLQQAFNLMVTAITFSDVAPC